METVSFLCSTGVSTVDSVKYVPLGNSTKHIRGVHDVICTATMCTQCLSTLENAIRSLPIRREKFILTMFLDMHGFRVKITCKNLKTIQKEYTMALRNKKNKKFGKPINVKAKLTRKEERKLKRKEKKVRRNEHYVNRKKPGQFVLNPTTGSFKSIDDKPLSNANVDKTEKCIENVIKTNKVLTTEQLRGKEKKEQLRIEKEMLKQRNKQLLEANFEEDRNIRHLEKQLKLNKRKSKSIPKSFAEDDLLEICDSEAMKAALTSEQEINEGNEEFKEDFALMANKTDKKEDFEDFLNEDDGSDQEMEEYEDDSEENDGLDYDLEDEVDIDESCSDNIYESDDEKSMSQKKLNSKRNLKPDVYDTAENMSETDDDRMPKKN
ncbi:hypothetical protein NQ317_016331 [Molorchus minor]|uniref:Uncharacterized protein n=1 Tax=Molorchus minor TaxID=1323400 RepID=A0ABQ9IZ60_9CUCU|nr:hypothetical protein NQ317_016331 [Molorchus minor]